MAASAVDDAGKPGEASSARSETDSNISPQPTGGAGLPLPNISVWAKWALGPVLLFAVPLYKRILGTEELVEKRAEVAVELAEEVAEVVKKVATDVANDLPASGGLRKMVIKIEEVADMVIVYAEEAEAFIHKVDEITEEVEEAMEQIIKEAESIQEEGK